MAEESNKRSYSTNQNSLSPKHLLQSDALYQYILQTSVYPREPECLKELRELTANHPRCSMAIPADQGQFFMLLLKLINAKKTIEIGVFTGYSLLCTALALPPDGKIIGMDISRESYDLGRHVIEKAGVAHKIDFREGPALPLLDEMIQNEELHGSFDFAFVDADKVNFLNYHERLLKLVKIGGVLCYDNTLWFGTVAKPLDATMPEFMIQSRLYTIELNKSLAADSRIEISQIPVGDGVTICRRIS
uniref:TSA: Wollemia nobilis Ref_Wollemi_Transcript_25652_998 transcribed RNA sequence n=1 Tax=Wollemia nobilis TaxID=56998 RepID=A0A0C9RGS7_9CONI